MPSSRITASISDSTGSRFPRSTTCHEIMEANQQRTFLAMLRMACARGGRRVQAGTVGTPSNLIKLDTDYELNPKFCTKCFPTGRHRLAWPYGDLTTSALKGLHRMHPNLPALQPSALAGTVTASGRPRGKVTGELEPLSDWQLA